jgi:hypothetical protein
MNFGLPLNNFHSGYDPLKPYNLVNPDLAQRNVYSINPVTGAFGINAPDLCVSLTKSPELNSGYRPTTLLERSSLALDASSTMVFAAGCDPLKPYNLVNPDLAQRNVYSINPTTNPFGITAPDLSISFTKSPDLISGYRPTTLLEPSSLALDASSTMVFAAGCDPLKPYNLVNPDLAQRNVYSINPVTGAFTINSPNVYSPVTMSHDLITGYRLRDWTNAPLTVTSDVQSCSSCIDFKGKLSDLKDQLSALRKVENSQPTESPRTIRLEDMPGSVEVREIDSLEALFERIRDGKRRKLPKEYMENTFRRLWLEIQLDLGFLGDESDR